MNEMNLHFAVTLGPGSSQADHTGTWRTDRPVYQSLTAPCGHACPAGEDVRTWLGLSQEGGAGYQAAWRRIMAVNPFPAIIGRVCYHPCETACNRGQLDEAVGINSVERFLGREAIRQGWAARPVPPASGKRGLVVGPRPPGLSAAYPLPRPGPPPTLPGAGPA